MATVTGSNGVNSTLTGTSARDRIYGDTRSTLTTLGGNDTINALEGDDYIYGDAYRDITGASAKGGNDIINGGVGNDTIYGDGNYSLLNGALGGNDTIDGGIDDDIITGDVRIAITGAGSLGGNDDIIGGSGNDRIYGDSRDDITNGGQGGVDTVYGGFGNDRIYGDAGDDLINATGGGDFLYGEDGDDIIAGDAADDMTTGSVGGNDTLDGDIGNDTLIGDAGGNLLDGSQGGVDTITGGVGDDIIFGDAGEDLNNSAIGGNDGLDGGDNNDLISGDAGNELKNGSIGGDDNIQGGDGDDRLYGDAVDSFLISVVGGVDTIDGGLGADIISGDAGGSFYDNSQGGNDILMAGNDTTGGPNIIYGDAGNTIYFSSHGGHDTITGSGVTDIVYGDAGVDIYGNSTGGNDTINTLGGDDEISGDAGRSLFDFAVGGDDIINAGAGNDIIYGDAKLLMRLNAQGGDDTIHGGADDDTISGDAGHKLYENAVGGDDTLYGDDGDDLIVGDTLEYITSGGVGGNDTISGGAGNDTIHGDALRFISATGFGGNDRLQGDAGNDFVYGNAGDDTAYYDWDVNNLITPYSDVYSGGEGNDTLIILTSASSDLVNITAGVQAYNLFLATTPPETAVFDFNPYGFDLLASGFENVATAPYANNDAFDYTPTTNVTGVSLIANDTSFSAGATTITLSDGSAVNVDVTQTLASGALLTVNADGTFDFNANGAYDSLSPGQTTTEIFTYTIENGATDILGNPLASQATVTITVTGENSNPVAISDSGVAFTTSENGVLAPQAVYSDQVLANSPILYWDFEETSGNTVNDISGNGNDGTYVGANLGATGAYTDSLAANFDGTISSYAILSNFTQMPTDTISVEFWVKTTGVGDGVVSYALSSTQSNEFLITTQTATQTRPHVNEQSSDVSVVINDGTYHHIVGTWNSTGGVFNLYVDGVLVGSPVISAGAPITAGGTLVLANEQDALGGGFNPTQAMPGEIDDFAIYNGILSPADVLAHYNAAFAPAINVNLLDNDSDPDLSDTLSVIAVNDNIGVANVGAQFMLASGALLTVESDGGVDYDTNNAFDALSDGETTTDSFTYTISDGNGGTDTATVTITIEGENDIPIATDNTRTIPKDAVITADGNLLLNDDGFGVDADVDASDILTVSIINGITDDTVDVVGTYGTLDWAEDGSYSYSVDSGNAAVQALAPAESLTESFTYTVSDGHGGVDTASLTITITGATATMEKVIASTSLASTGSDRYDPANLDVAIGEVVTYHLNISLVEGTWNNVVITDTLPDGFDLLSASIISDGGMTNSAGPGISDIEVGGILDDLDVTTQGLQFDFGTVNTLVDANPNDFTLYSVTLEISAIATDSLVNVNGTTASNTATLSADEAVPISGGTIVINDTVSVDIVEPEVLIEKSVSQISGKTFNYQVEVVNASTFAPNGDGVMNVQVINTSGSNPGNNTGNWLAIWDSVVGTTTTGSVAGYNIQNNSLDTETAFNYENGGRYGSDISLETINNDGPGGSGGPFSGGDNYSVRATAFLEFNTAGTYTLAIGSDDGRWIQLTEALPGLAPGYSGFTARGGQVNGSFAVGDSVIGFDGGTAHDESVGVFTVGAGDILKLEGFYYEGGGGDSGEISIASGSYSDWNNTSTFHLLSDGVLGGAVAVSSMLVESGDSESDAFDVEMSDLLADPDLLLVAGTVDVLVYDASNTLVYEAEDGVVITDTLGAPTAPVVTQGNGLGDTTVVVNMAHLPLGYRIDVDFDAVQADTAAEGDSINNTAVVDYDSYPNAPQSPFDDRQYTDSASANIDGINDAPSISAPVSVTISEDESSPQVVDLLTNASDPDTGDSINVTNLTLVSGDDTYVTIDGNTLEINTAAYQILGNADSATLNYSYDIVDNQGVTVAQTATITITGINDAPILSQVNATRVYDLSGSAATIYLDPEVNVADVDDINLESATLIITDAVLADNEVLAATSLPGGISANYVAATGTLTLTGSATLADYETALENITYTNNSASPTGSSRVIEITLNDGDDNSLTQSIALNYITNVAPILNDATLNLDEHTANGTLVTTLVATDPNIIDGDILTYTVTGGTGSAIFTLNASTGEITVADQLLLDYEVSTSFTLVVEVSDVNLLTDTALITININDLTPENPLFTENADTVVFDTDVSFPQYDPTTYYHALGGDDDVILPSAGNAVALRYDANLTFSAGAGSDVVTGNDLNDLIDGGSENDLLAGGAGDDVLNGDDGNDILDGGAGDDVINGGLGNDDIAGGAGDDILDGGAGNDDYFYQLSELHYSFRILNHDAGTNTITLEIEDEFGFEGKDTVFLQNNDRLFFDGFARTVFIHDDNNNGIISNNTSHVIFALGGNDSGSTSGGNDMVFGGPGDDSVSFSNSDEYVQGGLGADSYAPGGLAGNDTMSYSGDTVGVIINLNTNTFTGPAGSHAIGDSVSGSLKRLIGGSGDDDLTGNSNTNIIYGMQGNDVIDGFSGNDTLSGGRGNDTLTGGTGDDLFFVNYFADNDTITDFDATNDNEKLDLSMFSTDVATILSHSSQIGLNVVIDLAALGGEAGDSVTLLNVDKDDLDSNDFVLTEFVLANHQPSFNSASTTLILIEDSSSPNVSSGNNVGYTDADLADRYSTVITDNTPGGALGVVVVTDINLLTDTLSWTYTVANNDINFLAAGETRDEYFDIELDDGQGGTDVHHLTVTLVGVNDAPVFATNTDSGAVTEDSGPAILTDTGTVNFTDYDVLDTHSYSIADTTLGGAFGALNITVNAASIDWEYTIDNTLPAVQFLDIGQSRIESFAVTLLDNHGVADTLTIDITINGSDNEAEVAPQINPPLTFSIVENSINGSSAGTLSVTDSDPGDVLLYQVTGGTGATAFDIDPVTGDIVVVDAFQLDFETTTSFTLDVTVIDLGLLTDSETLTINITDATSELVLFTAGDDTIDFDADVSPGIYNPLTFYDTMAGDDDVILPSAAVAPTIDYVATTTVLGGAGSDIITGKDLNDSIDGGSENDLLAGGAGDDVLNGDDGNDILDGGAGDDVINGGLGNDDIAGGAGDDILDGGAGNDDYFYQLSELHYSFRILNHDTGTNTITLEIEDEFGFEGKDTVFLQNNDRLFFDGFARTVFIHDDNNNGIISNNTSHVIFALGGNDSGSTSGGNDMVFGGPGDDSVSFSNSDEYVQGGLGADSYAPGGLAGNDTMSYSGDTVGVIINLNTNTFTGPAGSHAIGDSVSGSLKRLIGGSGDDDLTGNSNTNIIYGMQGDDVIDGFSGNDTLSGGRGNDTLTGGTGNDLFFINYFADNDTITDFDATNDNEKLDLSMFSTDVATILSHSSQIGLNVVIDLAALGGEAGDSVTLLNVDKDDLDSNDFVLTEFFLANHQPSFNSASTTLILIEDSSSPNVSSGNNVGYTDADLADRYSTVITDNTSGGALGTVVVTDIDLLTDTLSWAYTVANNDINYLAAGETRDEYFDIELDDGQGGTDVHHLTVTLVGVNDAPVFATNTDSGAVTEDSGPAILTDTGMVNFTDVDLLDTHSYSIADATLGGAFGTLNITVNAASIDWEYTIDNTLPAVQFLDIGQSRVESFAVTLLDNHGAADTLTIDVTINGSDNEAEVAPQINAPLTFSIVENSISGTVVGTLNVTDSDPGDALTYTITGGTGATAFAIDDITGDITVVDPFQLDFEATTSFSLDVTVTDLGLLSDSETLTINITDAASELPLFTAGNDVIDFDVDVSAGVYNPLTFYDLLDGDDTVTLPSAAIAAIIDYVPLTTTDGGIGIDTITGKDLNDIIHGGDQNDILDGGAGDDILLGESGNDDLTGGEGDDYLDGGSGNDDYFYQLSELHYSFRIINHDTGTNTITLEIEDEFGLEGLDTVLLQNNDRLFFDGFARTVFIHDDNNNGIVSNNTSHVIFALGGDDSGDTSGGNDIVFGGPGDDSVGFNNSDDYHQGGLGSDHLSAGGLAGNDTMSYSGDTVGVIINLNTNTFTGPAGSHAIGDSVSGSHKRLIGGSGDDDLTGNSNTNIIYGMQGNDVIDGFSGNDILSGGRGNDILTGGSGNDVFIINFYADIDSITDFDATNDNEDIDLSFYNTDLSTVLANSMQVDADVVIDLGAISGNVGDSLTLLGVDLTNLTDGNDFLF